MSKVIFVPNEGWSISSGAGCKFFPAQGGQFDPALPGQFNPARADFFERFFHFTKELPQTIIGYYTAQTVNLSGNIRRVDFYGGATVLKNMGLDGGAGFTIGSYIQGDADKIEASPYNKLFQNEYGHYLQSQEMGFGYLNRAGIPSLFSAILDNGKVHSSWNHKGYDVEIDANNRSLAYFMNTIAGYNSKGTDWDYSNKIDPSIQVKSSAYYWIPFSFTGPIAAILLEYAYGYNTR